MTGFSGLEAGHDNDSLNESEWRGASRIIGPKWANQPTLSMGLLGVQIFWSVEMAYASPYLLSLGLSKSKMSMVFLAGPLSGLIVQPLIGVLADSNTSRFGRRRPYMIVGCILCGMAMLLLGYTSEVASIFTSNSDNHATVTIWLAVLAIYCMDFSINAVQAVDRALLVDTLPTAEQASGNAWAARMLGIGGIIGFFIGGLDLPHLFPSFGKMPLQSLSVITSVLLLLAHGLLAWLVKEKVLVSYAGAHKGFFNEMKSLVTNMLTLPRTIRQICMIQFFAWIAWFPVLFYTSTYIGELHKRASPIPESDEAELALTAESTRFGSQALLYSSVVSLLVNIILPFFVAEARQRPGTARATRTMPTWVLYCQMHLASLWAASHLLFAMCMAMTLFTTSVRGGSILITVTGVSWAVTQWAPFSLLGEAILTDPGSSPEIPGSISLADVRTVDDERQQLFNADEEDGEGRSSQGSSVDGGDEGRNSMMQHSGAQVSRLNVSGFEDEDIIPQKKPGEGLSAKAGIILGIHNIFIVIPQFLVTGLSAILFAVFEPDKSVLEHGTLHPQVPKPIINGTMADTALDSAAALIRQEEAVAAAYGPNSVAMIFQIGGVSAAVAFVLCYRLSRELRHRS